ncbi:MAG: hypothetical protein OEV06_07320 [Anaerolineae bacterium]|nr:hypothetical protein [Anaerolineae bacterium]
MKSWISKSHFLYLLVLFMVNMVACNTTDQSRPSEPANGATKTPVTTQTMASRTLTITPTARKTSIPSRVPTRVLTDLPWPPLPTIPVEDVQARLKYMINEDPDCYLPCWMGIIPGETTLNEAWHLLAPYTPTLHISDNTLIWLFEFEKNDNIELVPPWQTYGVLVNQFEFENEIISIIYADIYGARDRYQLEKFLNKYGKPSEIWFHASALGNWVAGLELHYTNIGIQLTYKSVIEDWEEAEDTLTFCFQEVSGSAEIWDPNLAMSFQDIYPEHHFARAIPLEKAAGISTEDFFNDFKDQDQACIDVSQDMLTDVLRKNPP